MRVHVHTACISPGMGSDRLTLLRCLSSCLIYLALVPCRSGHIPGMPASRSRQDDCATG